MEKKTKVQLDALLDQAMAHLAGQRCSRDPLIRAQLRPAQDLAGMLATQFPGELETAGRVAVVIAQAQTQLIREMRGRVKDRDIAPVIANLVAFAGEQLAREAGGS
jgi:hypothetical protein